MKMLSWMRRHPSDEVLRMYSSDQIPVPHRARIADHLIECNDCRSTVAFLRDLRAAAGQLPSVHPSPDLFSRIVAERAAGERIILPVEEQHPATRVSRRWLQSAVVAALVLTLGFAATRPWDVPLPTPEQHAAPVDARDPGPASPLAEMFAPTVAFAQPVGAFPSRVPTLSGVDGRRLRPGVFLFERRITERGLGMRVVSRGRAQLDSTPYDGRPAWRLVQTWTGAQTEAETVFVERTTLRPIGRVTRVRPYRSYDEIVIRQHFAGDSVLGWMHTDRTFGRPIARRLPSSAGWFIPSEALAPFLLEAVTLHSDWKARVALIGWAVRPDDVYYPITLRVDGEEHATVPAGTFESWRLSISIGTGEMEYWVRKSDGLGIRTRRTDASSGRVVEIVMVER